MARQLLLDRRVQLVLRDLVHLLIQSSLEVLVALDFLWDLEVLDYRSHQPVPDHQPVLAVQYLLEVLGDR